MSQRRPKSLPRVQEASALAAALCALGLGFIHVFLVRGAHDYVLRIGIGLALLSVVLLWTAWRRNEEDEHEVAITARTIVVLRWLTRLMLAIAILSFLVAAFALWVHYFVAPSEVVSLPMMAIGLVVLGVLFLIVRRHYLLLGTPDGDQ